MLPTTDKITAPTSAIPPDDGVRQLTLADPDDPQLRNIAMVGDTSTVLEILLMELSGVEHRTQGDLVRTLMVDHSTVAKSLRRLEAGGLVARRPSSEDRRVVIVSLTDAGLALVERGEAAQHSPAFSGSSDGQGGR